jgi:hypothetical protein
MSRAILSNINTVNTSLLRHFDEHHTDVHHVLLLLDLEEEDVGSSCWRAPELDVEVLDVGAVLLELDQEVLDAGRRAGSALTQGGGISSDRRRSGARARRRRWRISSATPCRRRTTGAGLSTATCGKKTAVGKIQNSRERLNRNKIPRCGRKKEWWCTDFATRRS